MYRACFALTDRSFYGARHGSAFTQSRMLVGPDERQMELGTDLWKFDEIVRRWERSIRSLSPVNETTQRFAPGIGKAIARLS